MKKLLIGFSSIFTFLTVSCSTSKPTKVDVIVSKNENKLYKNKYINELLNLYFTDSKLKNSYINDQENLPDSKFNELKYGLTFYPIFIHRSLDHHVGRQHFEIIQKAKKSIESTLKNDWYWFLDNIIQFRYIFNPYGDFYKEFDDDEKLFNQIEKDFGLTTSIRNKIVENLIKINFEDSNKINNEIKDVYSKKETFYLIFDKNKALKIWKYENNKKIEFQTLTDIFIFKDANNIEEQLIDLERNIFQKRKEEYENSFKIAEKDKEKDKKVKSILSKSNDKSFMKFHETDQYNERLKEALTEINKKELKIARYSLGGVYEQE
ncbi:aromatic motif membrane protein [Mycoplasma capricolum subsp. capricolum]|uniref:aromatic motif membrane protein n=1 Tax=Mycoplasma capricolum TaxID=2095 RepID=UPI003DA3407F